MPTGFVLQTPDGASYAVNTPLRLGRDYDCQVVLADARVSRVHATCWADGGRLFLRDENSSNGTYVNERRLERGQVVSLQPGDQVRLGGITLLAGLAAGPIQSPPQPVPAPGAPPSQPTVQMQLPSQPPRRRPVLPIVLGCGLLALVLGCAAVVAGALASGAIPMPFGPSPTSGLAASGTPLAPGEVTPPATVDPNPDGPVDGEIPLTPESVAPAPTPLPLEAFANSAAELPVLIAALNTAELGFVESVAAVPAPAVLDAHLQAVSAAALRVAVLAEQLGEAAAAQPQGGDGTRVTSAGYYGTARLALALVIESANAREALANGDLAPEAAAALIAEYGVRLWQPGFDTPPPPTDTTSIAAPAPNPAGRIVHNPFQAYTLSALDLPAVQFLSAEAAAEVLAAGAADEAPLHAWLALSSETFTRTLTIPTGGEPPLDPFSADLLASLFDPAAHAPLEGLYLARAVAAAHLALLSAGEAPPVQSAAPSSLLRLAAFQAPVPPALNVNLPGRVVAGAPPAPGADPALPAVPGGPIIPIFKSPFKVLASPRNMSSTNIPDVIAYEPIVEPSHMMRLRFDAIGAGSGQNRITGPNEDGLILRLAWEPAPNAIIVAGRAQFTLVCRASGRPPFVKVVQGNRGTEVVAFVVPVGVPHNVGCFLLLTVPDGPADIVSGMVVAQTEIISVSIPGIGDDTDHDNVPDTADACPDQKEDHDDIADGDGCPETDADNDGLLDLPDACPELAGPEPRGCPLEDADSDTVPDFKDDCPNAAEDLDNVADLDGCPETDADNDGLPDTSDKCEQAGEDFDNFEDADGCPDRDNDQDKFVDEEDACPNEAETANGFADDDGCPDAWPIIDLSGTLNETAEDNFNHTFGLVTKFNLTIDFQTGAITGTLTSTGSTEIDLTCYNVSDPSEIYDNGKGAYTVDYTATVTGAGLTPGGLIDIEYKPAGQINGHYSVPFTHDQCTQLNDDSLGGPIEGAGRLTILVTDFADATIALDWDASQFGATGSWRGRGTVR